MAFWNRRQQMGWAALLMGLSILLSRFMGLIRDKIISFFFGASSESDLYFAAFVIPDFINYLLAGAYFSITLIPLLSAYFNENEEEGLHFFSTVFTWIAIVITSLTAIAMVFATPLARLAAPGFQDAESARLAFFLRIILPTQIFFLLGSCFTAILYLRKQFTIPALTPLVYNLFIISGGLLLKGRGMEGFCWGVLVGGFVGNFLLPYLAVRQTKDLRLRFSLYHPGLRPFIYLALPLMIGQSIVVLDEQLVRIFGSLGTTGAVSWLNYARRIMLVPVGVVAQAAGVASYPFLAELAAKKTFQPFYQTLNAALRNTLTLLIPISVWMMAVSEPTITLIFQQGHFNRADAVQTSVILRIFLAVVFCWGIQQILARGFYAVKNTLAPTVLGTLTTAAMIPFFFILTRRFNAIGTASASALGIALYTLILCLWWRRCFGKDTFAGMGMALLKLTLFSFAACGPAVLITRFWFEPQMDRVPEISPYGPAFVTLAGSGICFGLVFVLLSTCFAPSLIRPFLEKAGPLGRRLLRLRAEKNHH